MLTMPCLICILSIQIIFTMVSGHICFPVSPVALDRQLMFAFNFNAHVGPEPPEMEPAPPTPASLQAPAVPAVPVVPLARQPFTAGADNAPAIHDLGSMDVACPSCHAMHWMAERLHKSTLQLP